MGLFDRLRGVLGERSGGGDAAYRCVRCGEGFDRPQGVCPECGSEFVAPTGDGEAEDGSAEDGEDA